MLWRELRRLGVNPERELGRLQGELNRLFDAVSVSARGAVEYPPVNVWAGDESVVVTAEVAGLSPDEIDISVVGDTLTLKGSRPAPETGEGASMHRNERFSGAFTRTVTLPYRVDADDVAAAYDRGVLSITLPRAAEDKPRKIKVTAD